MHNGTDHAGLNAQKWDVRARTYNKKWFDFMRYMQQRTIRLLPLKPACCFLDIGCGTGWAVRYVSTLLNHQGKFFGVDISPHMIEIAKEHSRMDPNIYFSIANAEDLSFQDNLFDCILCTNSFHHYLCPAKALKEMHRILKPHGRLYITDFTADGVITRAIDQLFKKREPEHVHFYGTQEYRRMFTEANLEYIGTHVIMLPVLKVHLGEKLSRYRAAQLEPFSSSHRVNNRQ